jgi:hypothetical protein
MNGTCPCLQNQAPQLPSSVQSWNDLIVTQPKDPMDLISYGYISGASASFTLSSTFLITTGTWTDTPFSIGPALPKTTARGSDSLQNVADADDWNLEHRTAIIGDPLLAKCLQKLIFLHAGTQWKNTIQLSLGGAVYNDLQLSFRDNLATRGDCKGTIPVLAFTGGALSGTINLDVVLKLTGHFMMALRATDGSGNKSVFEMEWVVV